MLRYPCCPSTLVQREEHARRARDSTPPVPHGPSPRLETIPCRHWSGRQCPPISIAPERATVTGGVSTHLRHRATVASIVPEKRQTAEYPGHSRRSGHYG